MAFALQEPRARTTEMIAPAFARTMARYNRWQNRSIYGAAGRLAEDERRKDHGAFFRSIHGTLNHLLWADSMWMSRLSDGPRPTVALQDSGWFCDDWRLMLRERAALDERIIAWADSLDDAWLSADISWWSGVLQADVVKPRWLAVVHMFNHQTHHRGQAHSMLTAAGATPEDTDLILM
jgi:uncharacterized damage-inducible protein DinB